MDEGLGAGAEEQGGHERAEEVHQGIVGSGTPCEHQSARPGQLPGALMPRLKDKREQIMDFSRGLNTDDPPVTLPDNMLPDLMNFIPFKKSLRKRGGRTLFSSALPSDSLLLKEWELSTGVRGTFTQFNATANKSGGTESKSLLYFETGNGVYAAAPWFNSGTAVF